MVGLTSICSIFSVVFPSLYILKASILVSSRSSHLPKSTLQSFRAATASAASLRFSKTHFAAMTCSGIGCSLTVTLVITPSVPSDPVISEVRSYPADDFRAAVPHLAIVPSGNTHSSPRMFSLIVPYFTAVVPEAPVATIPPIVASAPGSTTNCIPECLSASLRLFRVVPAPTLATASGIPSSFSNASTKQIWFMSRQIPP
mmetsp:Transcript_4085/g.7006  ORF Transcript_4085/g.7006 Transcript_4085/m.7006 type:complete len:201 (-) Transcript_4085:82-684(-)